MTRIIMRIMTIGRTMKIMIMMIIIIMIVIIRTTALLTIW